MFYLKKDFVKHRLIHFKIKQQFPCNICKLSFVSSQNLEKHLEWHARFKCAFCSEAFPYQNQLDSHEKLHTGNALKCFFCEMTFTSKNFLGMHEKTHGTIIKCEFCDKIFEKSFNYKAHLFVHRGRKPYTCSLCGSEFSQKGSLLQHIKFRHNEGNLAFTCTFCGKAYSHNIHLERHMRSHNQERPFFCNRCDAEFQTDQQRKRHLERAHIGIKKLFKCTMCPKQFNSLSYLNRHIFHHTGERPYNCPSCLKTFKRKAELEIHGRVHSGQKPFCCGTCGKRFKSRGETRLHEQIHLELKPYECKVCGKRFTQNSHMNTHLRYHSGKKVKCQFCASEFVIPSSRNAHEKRCRFNPNIKRPYGCSSCPKTLITKSALTSHVRVHSELRPFPCGTCGKRFKSKGEVKGHEILHLGLKPYECKICGQRFTQKGHMDTHLRTVHSGKVKCQFCMSELRLSSLTGHKKICKLNPKIGKREEKLTNAV